MTRNRLSLLLLLAALGSAGCRSPYYADRGALFGGLTGAGVGALVGEANGNAGAGAVIGSAVGAVTGAVVGEGIDADLARSRAEIEARMGRQMQGAVTVPDVIAMTQAGLSDDVITTHIRASGVAQPLAVGDLIQLRNMGVRDAVINAMQQTPPRGTQPVAAYPAYPAYPAGGPVIVEHHYSPWGPPVWCPPPRPHFHYHQHRPPGRVSWGVSMW
ncbi:MAG TPA: glycine zipper domain-containing protein [Pirellulaceae bacterium]|nr:glycine zipper domain-containing protein [Pirellulaceae bacterium]